MDKVMYEQQLKKCGCANQCSCEEEEAYVPLVHHLYGPGVFDFEHNLWTFPYAKYYNPDLVQSEIVVYESDASEEKVEVPKEYATFECQVDLDETGEPLPPTHEIECQTETIMADGMA